LEDFYASESYSDAGWAYFGEVVDFARETAVTVGPDDAGYLNNLRF
jgi:hypothetical protein